MANEEAFKFSGNDAFNYERYLGPVLFESSAIEFVSHIGSLQAQSVLEIAGGTGRLTRHLRERFPAPAKLVASDISPDMLELAKAQLNDPSIEFQVADAQQLPFEDDSFDLVVCQYGLMFLPDKQKGFSEARRVLKPGGKYIFATWDRTDNIPLFKLIFNDLVLPFFAGEDTTRFLVPFSLHDPVQLDHFMQQAGFKEHSVLPMKFTGSTALPIDIVNGLFLKHPLGREVAAKDPAAVERIAKDMEQQIVRQFGKGPLVFALAGWIGIGQK
jgi:ubiquinone/menaquinone biosynthesis C-methylase UbiE